MSRYIDADNAIERLGAYLMTDAQIEYGGLASEDIEDWKPIAIDILKGAPSIDIEPKRGEWKPFDLTWGRSVWYCTACEESTEVPCDIWEHKPIYKYCPNCGARMKGADDAK